MKSKKIKLFVIFSLFVSCTKVSAEWTEVVTSESGDIHYMDFSTIKKTGRSVRIWQMTDFKKKKLKGVQSFQSIVEHDCQENRSKNIQSIAFSGKMGKGKIIATFDEDIWQYNPPNSVGYTLNNSSCGN